MPTPGPLGRLVARRRMELGLTQQDLADLTARHGVAVTQNNISRLESGKTQRINDPARLEALFVDTRTTGPVGRIPGQWQEDGGGVRRGRCRRSHFQRSGVGWLEQGL